MAQEIAVVGILVTILSGLKGAFGIRFLLDREECLSHKVEYGANVRFSFVVIKVHGWRETMNVGVDLVVKGPSGEQIHDFRDKTKEMFDFAAHHEGVYRFCFTNKAPFHETIDFDVHASHIFVYDEHAKDEHFKPLMEELAKLEQALYNILYEQHWLEAQTDRLKIENEGMSKRAIHKAIFESAALIGASVLQVYLLRRLFNRKLGM